MYLASNHLDVSTDLDWSTFDNLFNNRIAYSSFFLRSIVFQVHTVVVRLQTVFINIFLLFGLNLSMLSFLRTLGTRYAIFKTRMYTCATYIIHIFYELI